MKKNVLLSYDESCGCLGNFSKDVFPYPVAYTDGFVSRLKSSAQGRTPWGFLIKGYIVSINPPKQEMTHAMAVDYCNNQMFAGSKCCMLPRGVLIIMMKNLQEINQMIFELGSEPLESRWYMAGRDCWIDESHSLYNKIYGVHPHYLYVGTIKTYNEHDQCLFFPAIKV